MARAPGRLVIVSERAVDWIEFAVALVVILAGAQLFTNGVEWIGEGFGLSEGAVGSVLAAIGTALPETILPFVAILGGHGSAGRDIGIGAILGAPFMLATLAMFVLGTALLVYSRGGRRSVELGAEREVVVQDLSFFLVMFALALGAGIWHAAGVRWTLAVLLLSAYAVYVRLRFRAPGKSELESEAASEVRPLYVLKLFRRLFRRADDGRRQPPVWASVVQTVISLVLILFGAEVFVDGLRTLSHSLRLTPLVFSLLVAPVATELPEQFNSVLWVGRRKDTLAIGNVTGAMVFQSSIPVSLGLLLTPWRLSSTGLISGALTLVAGLVLLVVVRTRGALNGPILLGQVLLYGAFVVYVVTRG